MSLAVRLCSQNSLIKNYLTFFKIFVAAAQKVMFGTIFFKQIPSLENISYEKTLKCAQVRRL